MSAESSFVSPQRPSWLKDWTELKYVSEILIHDLKYVSEFHIHILKYVSELLMHVLRYANDFLTPFSSMLVNFFIFISAPFSGGVDSTRQASTQ